MSKSLNNLSGEVRDGFQGFEDLSKIIEQYAYATENVQEAFVAGAKAFVNDLDKLPKPYSQIRKSGYTHLLDTFTYEVKKKEVIVGWGKYYGRMVENGTDKMDAKPHFYPLFERNKEKYFVIVLTKLGIKS